MDEGANIEKRQYRNDIPSGINGFTPLLFAVHNKHIKVANLLLDFGANITCTTAVGDTPLYIAVGNKDLSMIKLLVERGAPLNILSDGAEKVSPLIKATWIDNYEVVRYLIEKGADVNYCAEDRVTPLFSARSTSIVRLLLNNGASINQKNRYGETAFMKATNWGSFDKLKLLYELGADVKCRSTYDHTTPLHRASTPEKIDFLINLGFSIEDKAIDKLRPIQFAAGLRRIDCVARFIYHGAKINISDKEGNTILHDIVGKDFPQSDLLSEYPELFQLTSLVDTQNVNGNTPLHFAVSVGSNESILFLLDLKANLEVKNKIGLTPLDLAKQQNKRKILRLLKRKLSYLTN